MFRICNVKAFLQEKQRDKSGVHHLYAVCLHLIMVTIATQTHIYGGWKYDIIIVLYGLLRYVTENAEWLQDVYKCWME